jgi:tetratricopeptide (TPR) repeat protein
MSDIFVVYASDDSRYCAELCTHLQALENKSGFTWFTDQKIDASADWEKKLEDACNDAKCAIILVSAASMASSFISNKELLWLRGKQNIMLFPVLVDHVDLPEWMQKLQRPIKDTRPLAGISDESDRNLQYTTLIQQVSKALSTKESFSTNMPPVRPASVVDAFDFARKEVREALAKKLGQQFSTANPQDKTGILQQVADNYLTHFETNKEDCLEFAKAFERETNPSSLDQPLQSILQLLLIGPPKKVPHFPALGIARRRALFTNPHYVDLMLGMSLMGKTKYQEALKRLESIPLEGMERCALFWLEKGNCLRKLEKLARAEADLNKAKAIIEDWAEDPRRRCTCGDHCDIDQLRLTALRSIAVVRRKLGVDAFRADGDGAEVHFETAKSYFAEAIAVLEEEVRLARAQSDREQLSLLKKLAADIYFSFGYFLFEQGFLGTYKNPVAPSPSDRRELIGDALSKFKLSLDNNPEFDGPRSRIALIDLYFGHVEPANQSLRYCFANWGSLSRIESAGANIERRLSVVWTQIAAHGIALLQKQRDRENIGRWSEEDIRKLLYDTFTTQLVPQGPLECHTFDLNVVKYLLGDDVSRFDDLMEFMNKAVTWECRDLTDQKQRTKAHFPR